MNEGCSLFKGAFGEGILISMKGQAMDLIPPRLEARLVSSTIPLGIKVEGPITSAEQIRD